MRKIAISLLLLFMAATAAAADIFPSVPKKMIASTHRLVVDYKSKEGTVFEHGAAVAVDLSKRGIPGKNFLLTAEHCVARADKDNVLVEIQRPGKSSVWTKAKVIARDAEMDIAIIATEVDLPDSIEIADDDSLDIGDAVIAIGSPKGQSIASTMGFLSDKGQELTDKKTRNFWQASMAVYHGNSGGGLFDANRGKLVGIVTAIVVDDDGKTAAPNIAEFVGTTQIRKFIDDNMKKLK